jgi:hypothetical protein
MKREGKIMQKTENSYPSLSMVRGLSRGYVSRVLVDF